MHEQTVDKDARMEEFIIGELPPFHFDFGEFCDYTTVRSFSQFAA